MPFEWYLRIARRKNKSEIWRKLTEDDLLKSLIGVLWSKTHSATICPVLLKLRKRSNMVQGSKRKSKSVNGCDFCVIPKISKLRKGDISAEISFVAYRINIYGWQYSVLWTWINVGNTRFNTLSFLFVLWTVGYLNIQLSISWIFIYPTTVDWIVKINVD